MRYIKYGKHVPDPFEGLSAEDLMQMLQDFLLDSGFYNQYYGVYEMDSEKTMEQLRQALLEALEQKGMISEELLQEMLENPENSALSQALDRMLQQLADEGYVSIEQPQQGAVSEARQGQMGQGEGQTKFEITDKALDFLGFKTLKDLLGSLGKSSFGRHDTREMATGVESDGSSR
ncbi:MAG TPA: hypothetical protein VNM47_16450, partial [Terriglobia bacterium]|nr:hypothetical protein [Terriglobia bacterium]